MMNIEFISDVYTSDDIRLPMVHYATSKKDICVICIHGMCANFADNYFASVWGKYLSENGIGFLYEYNRGHDIENDLVKKDGSFLRCGTMYEVFEDCIMDIDLAIKVAKEKGYQRIVLLGHSYGCNKVIYYYYKKRPNLLGIILASAPDMVGSHITNQPDYQDLLQEAKQNIDNGNSSKLLSKMVEDYMYMSSKTYYNWYHENANLDNLPVVLNPKCWEQFSKIDVPIFTFSGSEEEEYYLQLELLKEKALSCKNFSYQIIEGTGHTYRNKELEIAKLINRWIENL